MTTEAVVAAATWELQHDCFVNNEWTYTRPNEDEQKDRMKEEETPNHERTCPCCCVHSLSAYSHFCSDFGVCVHGWWTSAVHSRSNSPPVVVAVLLLLLLLLYSSARANIQQPSGACRLQSVSDVLSVLYISTWSRGLQQQNLTGCCVGRAVENDEMVSNNDDAEKWPEDK